MRIKKNKGFTLIELLIVVAIIGIVAAIAIPNLLDAMNRARFKATMGDIRSVGEGVESYRVDNSGRVPVGPTYLAMTTGAGSIESNSYMKNPPQQDGWGHALVYTVWDAATLADYTIAAWGSDGIAGAQGATIITQMTSSDMGVTTRESRLWSCDIVFQDGQFSFGGCK